VIYHSSAERAQHRRRRAKQGLPTMCRPCYLGHLVECEADWCACMCNESASSLENRRFVFDHVVEVKSACPAVEDGPPKAMKTGDP
jgi:hypothetical protein